VHATPGTVFSDGDSEERRSQPGVVLSHRLWKSQFGSDPNIIGRSILVDDVSRVVWGIAPRWFHSVASRLEQGPAVDFWIPTEAGGESEDGAFEGLVGRLKPGASLQALRMETESAFRRPELRKPGTPAPLRPVVLSDPEYRNAEGYPAVALSGIGIGCVFLLIACFNVSGSLLTSLTEAIHASVGERQEAVKLAGTLSLLGLILACAGLYGVVSFAVGRRTQELGIRMAVGALRQDIIRLILWHGVKLGALGLLLGLGGTLVCGRVLKSALYGISPVDPAALTASCLLLMGVALAACYLPARRAARIEPMAALRHE